MTELEARRALARAPSLYRGPARGVPLDGDRPLPTGWALRRLIERLARQQPAPDDEKDVQHLKTPEGAEEHAMVTEGGSIALIRRSRKSAANDR